MKILFVTDPKCLNPYPCELADYLTAAATEANVTVGIREFWESDVHFDIIHFHWVEELFNWKDYAREKMISLLKRIDYWKSEGTSIVFTIHNIKPHAINWDCGVDIYREVFRKGDLFIHLGEVSKRLFREAYGDEMLNRFNHSVIPHGLFTSYDKETVDRNGARKFFGINGDDFVMLSFGNIRKFEEAKLIFNALKAIDVKEKKMIISNFRYSSGRFRRIIEKTFLAFQKDIIANSGFVEKEMVPYYFRAADIVFIPRIEILNSGNLFLGFFYEKVVVGPDIGVVGEILKEMGNPVFIPGNKKSLSDALMNAKILVEDSKKGYENYLYACENFNWNKVSSMHFDAYNSVIQKIDS